MASKQIPLGNTGARVGRGVDRAIKAFKGGASSTKGLGKLTKGAVASGKSAVRLAKAGRYAGALGAGSVAAAVPTLLATAAIETTKNNVTVKLKKDGLRILQQFIQKYNIDDSSALTLQKALGGQRFRWGLLARELASAGATQEQIKQLSIDVGNAKGTRDGLFTGKGALARRADRQFNNGKAVTNTETPLQTDEEKSQVDKDEIARLNSEIAALTTQLETARKEADAAGAKIASLTAAVQTANKAKAEADKLAQETGAQLNALQGQYNASQKNLANLQGQYDADKASWVDKDANYQSQIQSANNTNAQLRASNDGLRDTVNRYNTVASSRKGARDLRRNANLDAAYEREMARQGGKAPATQPNQGQIQECVNKATSLMGRMTQIQKGIILKG